MVLADIQRVSPYPSRFIKAIFQTKADPSLRGVQVPAVKRVAPGENRAVTNCCENKPVLQMWLLPPRALVSPGNLLEIQIEIGACRPIK